MPVKEAEVVQISSGQMNFRTMEFWGRDTFILKIANSAYASFTARPHPGWIGLLTPMSWTGDFRLNACRHELNSAYYLDGTHEYTVACQDSVRLLVGIRRRVMDSVLSEISGDIDVDFLSGSRIFDDCSECVFEMEEMISSLQTDGIRHAATFEGTNLSQDQERAVVAKVAHVLLEKMECPTSAWLGQIDDYHITTTIRDAIRDRPLHEDLRLEELYEIAGAGKNRLHKSFVNVYGAPPVRYLKLRRLWRARQFLLDPKNSNCKIGDVAFQFGFPSSGRLAKSYQAVFEELPRDTVKRAKGTASRGAEVL
ncbi:helix-turn-helix domain-containing protein [Ruegeria profundi]|uniref:helix-turn-helix domain-containing protein n=1 Tax=Ruegeria profundi TaxID=1685378 RepID=UPI001CD67265|nr:helix-turn-helix domain-containing protein [Ruegeria profundi]MCA0928782.1 helix-turn-helix domain-containing protein [Ruegeria profundi]